MQTDRLIVSKESSLLETKRFAGLWLLLKRNNLFVGEHIHHGSIIKPLISWSKQTLHNCFDVFVRGLFVVQAWKELGQQSFDTLPLLCDCTVLFFNLLIASFFSLSSWLHHSVCASLCYLNCWCIILYFNLFIASFCSLTCWRHHSVNKFLTASLCSLTCQLHYSVL